MPPSTDNSRFGPYVLLYPLGAGGMGEVFLARHSGQQGIQRLVALKRMLGHLNKQEKLARLFVDEVRIAAQLNHGNIVQVIDHGDLRGDYFMVMEYVHGENLAEILTCCSRREERIPLELLLQLACCVCEGLDYAHAKESLEGRPLGIVHRDISPPNILISFQGEVKIADFGVARAAEQTHVTLGGELKGKLAYMSPEQATGKPLDLRSDLYSLGVVLYEALAGVNPLQRKNAMATLEAVRAPQIPALGVVRPDLPGDVADLVHQALARPREERPSSARALHESLQASMRGHSMVVSPFDLADWMQRLFPEIGKAEPAGQGATTEVGRRADEDAGEELEGRTLAYLRQRHLSQADAAASREETGEVIRLSRAHPRLWLALVALAALLGAGTYAVLPSPPAPGSPHRDMSSARSSRDSAPPDLPEPIAVKDAGGQTDRGRPRRALPIRRTTRRPTPQPTTISVRSTHPCRLLINGAPSGDAPQVGRPVSTGSLTVTCLNAARNIRETVKVRARPGEAAQVNFRFGVLAVNLEPWASVIVDGRARGSTPLRLLLPEGEHGVLLTNTERGLRRRLAVEIVAKETRRISNW